MTDKILLKGNQALCEGAIKAGLKFYGGYPITPQNEVPEYLSKKLPEANGEFVQAESELAAINMIFGAAAAGARAMTSSSSPGISLKQEGISYIAAAELPCVIVNMVRGGPGLGNIAGSQSDYFQSTRGGGHGDYRLIIIAPNSAQECYDLTMKAFDLADFWKNPVMILGDGFVGQMVEPVELKPYEKPKNLPAKDWALTGCKGRKPNVVKTLYLNPADMLTKRNIELHEKYDKIKEELSLYEEYETEDADIVLIAYGIASRVCKGAVKKARAEGIKVGLIRPITLWPFPEKTIQKLAKKVSKFLVVELSMGQMVEDVKLSIDCSKPVEHYGFGGGWIPSVDDIVKKIKEIK
jgi:2-oxoglutarate ferredoxin oxidoreductase subunit alpha